MVPLGHLDLGSLFMSLWVALSPSLSHSLSLSFSKSSSANGGGGGGGGNAQGFRNTREGNKSPKALWKLKSLWWWWWCQRNELVVLVVVLVSKVVYNRGGNLRGSGDFHWGHQWSSKRHRERRRVPLHTRENTRTRFVVRAHAQTRAKKSTTFG